MYCDPPKFLKMFSVSCKFVPIQQYLVCNAMLYTQLLPVLCYSIEIHI